MGATDRKTVVERIIMPDELKDAVQEITRSIWNQYYAPRFGDKDISILSIYSHFINGSLYLHSYVLGNIIVYQLYDFMEGKDFHRELERNVHDWSLDTRSLDEKAIGEPMSASPMLRYVCKAIGLMNK